MNAPLTLGLRIPLGDSARRPTTGHPDLEPSVLRARRLVTLADELGVDYAFASLPPAPVPTAIPFGPHVLDPFEDTPARSADHERGSGLPTEVILALLAASRRLRLVAPVAAHAGHPALLARFATVADRVSNGRFAVDLYGGLDPDDRRPAEFGKILRGGWDGGTARRARPAGRPELIVSGPPGPALPLAASSADWYVSPSLAVEAVPARRAALALAGAEGKERVVRFGMAVTLAFGSTSDALVTGTPEEIAVTVNDYRDAGVEMLVLDLEDPERDLPIFAAEVLPRVRAELAVAARG